MTFITPTRHHHPHRTFSLPVYLIAIFRVYCLFILFPFFACYHFPLFLSCSSISIHYLSGCSLDRACLGLQVRSLQTRLCFAFVLLLPVRNIKKTYVVLALPTQSFLLPSRRLSGVRPLLAHPCRNKYTLANDILPQGCVCYFLTCVCPGPIHPSLDSVGIPLL